MSGSRPVDGAPAPSATEPPSHLHTSPPPADGTHVPRLASGVVRLGPMAGSGYRNPPRLVRRGDGQIIQLSPLLDAVLEAIDGRCDLALVTDAASEYHGQRLHVDDVGYLIEHKLRPLGLVRSADGAEPVVSRANPLLGLRGRIPVTRPERTWTLTRPFLWLFHAPVVAVVTAAFTGFTMWVLFGRGIDLAVAQAMRDPGTVLALLGLIVASGAFHEIGHATACRFGGARPGVMGAALYLVWPAFYTDVTDSYRLGRVGRLRVDLGGLYFNAVFTLAAGAAWALTSAEALLVLVPVQLAQMVRQLIPLVRFDGYHILADLVGVPDLFARIRPTLRRALPWHWRDAEPNPLRPWAQAVVVAWVLAVVPALAFVFGYLLVHLPEMLAGAGETLTAQADLVGQHLDRRNVEAVALGVVSMGLVALLPLSTVYLLTRVAHRTSRGVWRATDGHPVLRAGAVGVVVIALAMASPGLLPTHDPDRTMAASGTGEIAAGAASDAGEVAPLDTVEVRPALHPMPVARRTEQHAKAEPNPDRSSPPTTAAVTTTTVAPVPAVPATSRPRATVPEPVWPFSFAPPAPAGPGDNQVVVVNARDGASRFELSADLRWDHDDTIDQANRAYALASCIDCRTVAAAFQLVLATVPNHVAVPENLAVAVNEDCDACVTEAVASQVVITLTGEPDRSVRNRLEALVKAADARQAWFAKRTPAEILTEFRRLEAEALSLLAPWIPAEATDGTAAAEEEPELGDGDLGAGDLAVDDAGPAVDGAAPDAEAVPADDPDGVDDAAGAELSDENADGSTEDAAAGGDVAAREAASADGDASAATVDDASAEPTDGSVPEDEGSGPEPAPDALAVREESPDETS